MDPTAIPQTSVQQQVQSTDAQKNESSFSFVRIIVYIVVLLIIVYLFYLAYKHFTAQDDSFVEGQRQERDDPAADFDLQKSIKQLEAMQQSILQKNVSNDTGY
jgi:cytochrome c-type biogenesis protein CcmH/NrfG